MKLEEYRRKRNFTQTPEPRGRARSATLPKARFVVQKHDATNLHYDFRLEIEGVLVSWAVPKGPSLNPADKRLAVMTEDHPLEYAGFEGTIPEGGYGAGTVMVWDAGTFETEGDMPAANQLALGELKVTLHGHKLNGGFVLVHTGKRSENPSQQKRWLLIKHRDEYALSSWDITQSTLDRSVVSRRKLDEIAAGQQSKRRRTSAA
jgi:bifunctional non-homologous end joining protein LigD